VIRSQGYTIRELQAIMPTKCNKSELTAGLSLKANTTDVSRMFRETADLITNLTNEKLAKSELHAALSGKASFDEVSRLVESKASIQELHMFVQ
jgi:hypothetical protein